MTSPPIPAAIAQVMARYPDWVRFRLLEVRDAIFTVAETTPGVDPLTETLKWGEAAYLTEASRSGSTIRLGLFGVRPAIFFNCRTSLVEQFRAMGMGEFGFEGNRALLLPTTGPLPREALDFCLRAALTYHRHGRRTR